MSDFNQRAYETEPLGSRNRSYSKEEASEAPNQWWDFMDVFPNKQASVTTLPRDREGTSNLIAQPIIATIPGKTTTMPPPSTGEDEFGGDRFAEINTRFQGSIDKLDSAYALNSYAALS